MLWVGQQVSRMLGDQHPDDRQADDSPAPGGGTVEFRTGRGFWIEADPSARHAVRRPRRMQNHPIGGCDTAAPAGASAVTSRIAAFGAQSGPRT